jgi:hypothetical protein
MLSLDVYTENGHDRSQSRSRMYRALVACVLCLAAMQSSAGAATYFVDPVSGNDTRNGQTRENAWKTIPYAEQNAANGSTICLMNGNYGRVSINRSGNNGRASWTDALTFTPDTNAHPIVEQLQMNYGYDVDSYIIWDGCSFIWPDGTDMINGGDVVSVFRGGYVKLINCQIKGRVQVVPKGLPHEGEYALKYCTDELISLGMPDSTHPIWQITVQGCHAWNTGEYGIMVFGPVQGPIVIRDNDVHHFGSSGIGVWGTPMIDHPTTIQGNRIHNQISMLTRDYSTHLHGSGIHINTDGANIIGNRVWAAGNSAPIRAYQNCYDGVVKITGSWSDSAQCFEVGEEVSQGKARGKLQSVANSYIEIGRATSDTVFNATDRIVSTSHSQRVWIPQSILQTRTWGGYRHLAIKNNIVFHAPNIYPIEVHDIGPGCQITHNTTIGSTDTVMGSRYFRSALYLTTPPYYNDLATLQICNNLFVGLVAEFPAGCTAKGNICFSYFNGAACDQAWMDSHFPGNRVYNWVTDQNTNVSLFTMSGKTFVGGSLFDSTGFTRATVVDQVMAVPTAPGDMGHSYDLASGSIAIGTADPKYATATDIWNNPRDARPDVGCSEYIADGGNGPTLAQIGNKNATVGTRLTFQATASDPDGNTLTYSASGLPQGATFSGQTFAWTPTADQVGSDQVTFSVSDGQGRDSETITITVAAAQAPNAPPVLGAVGSKSVRENELLSFSVSATDADSQDTLTYSAAGLPSGAGFSGRAFSWKPGYGQAGSYQVTFTVSDGHSQDSEAVTISVTNTDRAPVLNSVSDQSVDSGSTLQFSLSAADPDGDSLTYSATGMPTGATLSGGSFTWTPTASQIGSYDVTFTASDGSLKDSKTATITVAAARPDTTAPAVVRCTPEPDSIQVPLNHLVTVHVTDAGIGVDAGTVVIRVNDQVAYQGTDAVYTSAYGRCSRSGSKSDYRYIYQPDRMFDFDQTVVVKVNAKDLQGNVMSQYAYSYMTEMQSFGANKPVSHETDLSGAGKPVTVRDPAGNLWAAWHAGPQGARDIYVTKLAPGAESFRPPVRLTTDTHDQCNPDLAAGPDGKVYVTWQDNRRGNWDIFASICTDRQTFSGEIRVSDSNDNEINPAVAIDGQSPNRAYVAWQDGRNGNQDIYVASSANGFASTTVSRVTTNAANQMDPDIAVGGQNIVYVVWTDMRSGRADLYGAASNAGPWTNIPIVTAASDQTAPAVAAERAGSALHLVWVDNARGNQDIYYAMLAGLPSSPVTGSCIVDDTSGADQISPTVVCAENGKAFACWQDSRHAGADADTDLYVAELRSGVAGTNILVGDDNTNAGQTESTIGVNALGHPYMVWADDRGQPAQIYYAAATFIDPDPLDSKLVAASAGATIGTAPAAIDQPEDVSIVVPPGAFPVDLRMTISKILNPQVKAIECMGSYDFGPSGIDFDQPVTVTIPYAYSADGGQQALPYWYDSLTGVMSQQGITDVETIVVSSNLNALRFKTTHFTAFYVVARDPESGITSVGAASGGGGCSISATGKGSPRDLVLPYAAIATIMIILRRRDKRRQKALDKIQE